MTKMAAMPIYGKNMKNSSSLEPKADDLESFCAALYTQYNRFCSNDDPGFTLTNFTARSWETVKTMDFSELLWSVI